MHLFVGKAAIAPAPSPTPALRGPTASGSSTMANAVVPNRRAHALWNTPLSAPLTAAAGGRSPTAVLPAPMASVSCIKATAADGRALVCDGRCIAHMRCIFILRPATPAVYHRRGIGGSCELSNRQSWRSLFSSADGHALGNCLHAVSMGRGKQFGDVSQNCSPA